MKNLNTVFDLLLFPFLFLIRKILLFSLLFLTGTMLFASTVPVVSVEPATQEVTKGTLVTLTLTANPAPDSGSIAIGYTITGDCTTTDPNPITIDANKISATLDINTSTMVNSAAVCTVVLDSVTGDGANQSDGNVNATDGTATITLINQPPLANDKTYQICSSTDIPLTGNIITGDGAISPYISDSDPDGDDISLLGDNSTFTIAPDGGFSYTPEATFYGDYLFDYNITDGDLNSSTAIISIHVLQDFITKDDYFTFETATNTSLKENVLTNDGSTNYYVKPENKDTTKLGHVIISDNGAFTYTPKDENWTGVDTFTYTVSDTACNINVSATVTIDVYDMCDRIQVLTINPCSDNNHTTIHSEIIGGYPQVYSFNLPVDAGLELNISNKQGGKELKYDYQQTSCSDIFASGTDSYLGQGKSINLEKWYPADTYYLGFDVEVWGGSTEVDVSMCYDTNSSGDSLWGLGNTAVGINNKGVDYNIDHDITTKIVNKSFGLRASYLGADGSVVTYYDGRYDGGKKSVGMPVILQLYDDGCSERVGTLGHMIIEHATEYNEIIIDSRDDDEDGETVIDYAAKIRAIQYSNMDWGAIFSAVTDLSCQQSSFDNSLCGLPACLNTIEKIKEVFPPAFYPKVNTCIYGDNGGGLPPCNSNAYTGNCGGLKVDNSITPEEYDTDYGCFDCLTDAFGDAPCSDDFAIRPKAFDVNITGNPTFKAGKPINLSFLALDENGVANGSNDIAHKTRDYNETQDTSFYIDLNVSNNSGCQIKNLSISPNVSFSDGIHQDNFRFSDIGDINMSIHETNGTEFAIIDADDTPLEDRLIQEYNATFTVIPDHFNIDANLTDHNNVNNFTYLHDINQYEDDDNYAMGAALTIDIKAVGAQPDENITRNYTEGCYAKDTNLTLVLDDFNITYPGSIPALEHFLYHNPVEDNGSADSGEGNYSFPTTTSPILITSLPIESIASTFPADPADADGNGTTHIEYKLNFDRKIHLVVNPFKMVLSDVNITEVDTTITDPDNLVKGETGTLTNQSATLYYARSRASKFFYEHITEDSVITPNLIDVYCALPTTACSNIGIDTVSGAIDDINWYISTDHTSNDGNITLMVGDPLIEGTGSPTINGATNPTPTDITNWSTGAIAGADDTVNVAINGSNVPLTVPIELVRESDTPTPAIYTNEWLIYNPNDPIPLSPFYKVRFIGKSTWTGEGQTGHVVDVNSSYKKSNRMDW